MGQNQNQNTAPVKIENAAQLRSAYPDMINQIVDEAIQNERDRLKAIDEIANGIPDDVLKRQSMTSRFPPLILHWHR